MSTQLITAVARDSGVEESDPATVPWWSFTKTVLAAAALCLVAQGRLHLDKALPGKQYTLRQLLQHRAGVTDYGPLATYHQAVKDGEAPWSIAELLDRTRAGKLRFEPGKGWEYSNIGYLFVRQLVEETAGAPIGTALDQLVFSPLGITEARIADKPNDLIETAWGNDAGYHPGWVYHGLLIGKAASAAMLLHRLLAGHLLPATLLTTMLDPHLIGGPISGRPWQSAGYGLGLMIGAGEPPGTYVGHTGGGPGSVSAVYQWVNTENRTRRTAAAFAPFEAQDAVERRAMVLAHQG